MRSGTVPTPLAVGLGAACHIAKTEMEVILILILIIINTYILSYTNFNILILFFSL